MLRMVVEMPDLSGKRAVITGGSEGLGKELAIQARRAGASVAASYFSRQNEAAGIAQDHGIEFYHFSLGDINSTREFLDSVGRGGPIDYFIANAGVEKTGGLDEHDEDTLFRIINANVFGNAILVRNLLTQGMMAHGGQISVIGSIAAQGNHHQLGYSMSKASLEGINSLNYDAAVLDNGLGVKILEPAFIRGTKMSDRTLRLLERKVIPAKARRDGIEPAELVRSFNENSGYVSDCAEVATEVWRLTVHPLVTGPRRMPDYATIKEMRAKYIA